MLVVLAVLDPMEPGCGDRRDFKVPAHLFGVVGEDCVEALSAGSLEQLDVLGASPSGQVMDVQDVMSFEEEADDVGHRTRHVLVEQQFQAAPRLAPAPAPVDVPV